MLTYPIHCFLPGEGPNPELWDIHDSPREFYVQGKEESLSLLERLPRCGLAVVGTRFPQERSIELIETWLPPLARTDMIILSGLARGIDAVAHQTALKFGIPTIALVGSGLNECYPPENADLKEAILESGGLVISEYPIGTAARPAHFIQRNRLIAGWSKATWVVEAPFRSGALNTAAWARKNHRTVFATPAFPRDPALAGNQTLLDRDGAFPVWGIHSFSEAWLELASLPTPGLPFSSRKATGPQSADQRILYRYLRHETTASGGVRVESALSWALSEKWTAERFFCALQQGLTLKWLEDRAGTLTARIRV